MTMKEKILELKNYKISYGNKTMIYEDIEIYEGEFIGLMGTSGCGKTSLLNSLFSYKFSGKTYYDKALLFNRDLRKWQKDMHHCISYMPQFCQDALNPKITIEEQVKLTTKGNDIEYDKVEVLKVMTMLALNEDVLNKYPFQLSGGMKQRIVLLLSYIKKPRLLILDEPSSALDLITLNAIIKFLRTIENKCTIILVSHNEELLKNLCHRIIVPTKS